MRYRKPFTLTQRQDAISAVRSFQVQLRAIRIRFRPSTAREREVARELRRTVEDFVDALRVPDAKVNVGAVNNLRERADFLGLEYAMLWAAKPGRPHDA